MNKDRAEDDVMEEILQDPVKFEELIKKREKPSVKKFVLPVPSKFRAATEHSASGRTISTRADLLIHPT